MKKLITGILLGTVIASFVLTVTGYIDLRDALAQVRPVVIELDRNIKVLTIASGITTNTTSPAVEGVRGEKTYWARVAGTGSITATVEHLGCQTSTVSTSECVSLAVITLTGTTSKYSVPSPSVGSANFPYHAITTTNVTGTNATVSGGVNY